MKIPSKVYDILKYITQYVIPGLGTLYFALSTIWGLPYGEQVVGTLTAIDTFLGVLLGISSTQYKGDGSLTIDTSDPEKDRYMLNMTTPLDDLPKKDKIMLKVDNQSIIKPE